MASLGAVRRLRTPVLDPNLTPASAMKSLSEDSSAEVNIHLDESSLALIGNASGRVLAFRHVCVVAAPRHFR